MEAGLYRASYGLAELKLLFDTFEYNDDSVYRHTYRQYDTGYTRKRQVDVEYRKYYKRDRDIETRGLYPPSDRADGI